MTLHPWRAASLVAPQVDYEPALHSGADGLPRLDLKAVPWEPVASRWVRGDPNKGYVEVLRGERIVARHPVPASPSTPWSHVFTLSSGIPLAELLIVVREGEQVLARFRPQSTP
jgi:hypothetical protein